jgi:hypothetical protein
MRTPIASIALATMLAACATPEQQAAYKQQDMDRMMSVYGPACSRLGYAASSDQWRNCVLQLSIKDDAAKYAYYPYYYPPWWRGGAF